MDNIVLLVKYVPESLLEVRPLLSASHSAMLRRSVTLGGYPVSFIFTKNAMYISHTVHRGHPEPVVV